MSVGANGQQPYPGWATVRDRCRSLGMPTWRTDTVGAIIDEPAEPGLAGLWLRSGYMSDLVAKAARAASEQQSAEISQPFPGCRLLPIVDEVRRRRIGTTLALALGPEALDAPEFAAACRSAGLDETTTRLTLRRLATLDGAAADRIFKLTQWMSRDLTTLCEHEAAVAGFTTELGQSYETIDLLYSLGRSMLDLQHPDRFVVEACDRLHETMPFGWLAAKFLPDSEAAGAMASKLLARGTLPGPEGEFDAAVLKLGSALTPDTRGYIVPGNQPLFAGQESRILAQPIIRNGRIAGIMICGDKQGDDPQISSYDMQLLEAAAAYSGAFLENAGLYQDQQAMFLGSLKALTAAIDAKDRYTCGHSERVALIGRQLAILSGMSPAEADRVHITGLLHDVGKIGVPESVLCKPGRLTDAEFQQIRLHPEIGYRILQDIPKLDDVLPGVLHHHERWDGKGYPHGLAGQAIPPVARLLALADTFDAMSSTRSYRPAMPRDKVLAEIAKQAGSQFDPELAARFSRLDLAAYDAMVARHATEHQNPLSVAA